MGEKETAREASAPSLSERTAGGGGDATASEHVYQHNQTDMDFLREAPGGDAAERASKGKPTKEQ